MLYPLLFRNNFFSKIWGGSLLKKLKGIEDNDPTPIGESWR